MGNVKLRTTRKDTYRRDCIGPRAVRKPHTFLTTDPQQRVCERCRREQDRLHVSPMALYPVRITIEE